MGLGFKSFLSPEPFTMVAIAALLATFSAINATIYGNARLGYTLAKEGTLPKRLAQENHRKIPTTDVWVTAGLSLLLANSIDLTEIAIIGSAGFLLIFMIVNLSAFKVAKTIHANRILLFFATLFSALALITLLLHTYESNPNAIVVFFAFVQTSVAFEWIYGKWVRGHFLKREY